MIGDLMRLLMPRRANTKTLDQAHVAFDLLKTRIDDANGDIGIAKAKLVAKANGALFDLQAKLKAK